MHYPVIAIDGVTEKVAPSIAITHYTNIRPKTQENEQNIPMLKVVFGHPDGTFFDSDSCFLAF